MEYLSNVVDFGHYGFVSYQIRMKKSDFGWYQRHEWLTENGDIEIDEWISTKCLPNKTMIAIKED